MTVKSNARSLTVLFSILLVISAFAIIEISQSPNNPPNYTVSPYSWIVISDGNGNFYAKFGANGSICCQSYLDALPVIQYANNHMNVTGGTIFIRKGLYPLNGSIILGGPTWNVPFVLEGEGASSTVLKLMDGVNQSVIMTSGYAKGSFVNNPIVIENLKIDGNRQHNNAGDGIDFMAAYGKIDSCYIINCAGAGIKITGGVRSLSAPDNYVTGCHVSNCTDGCDMVNSGSDVVFVADRFFRNNNYGIYINAGDSMISSCSIYGNQLFGLYIYASLWSQIQGNWFGNAHGDILISAGTILPYFRSSNIGIVDNNFNAFNRPNPKQDPIIELSGTNENNPVSNVRIVGNGFLDASSQSSYAIKLDHYVHNVTITGNTFEGTFGYGVLYQETDCSGVLVSFNAGYTPSARDIYVTIAAAQFSTTSNATIQRTFNTYLIDMSKYQNVIGVYLGVGGFAPAPDGGSIFLYDVTASQVVSGSAIVTGGDQESSNFLSSMNSGQHSYEVEMRSYVDGETTSAVTAYIMIEQTG